MKKGIFTLFSALLFSLSLSAQTATPDTITVSTATGTGSPQGTDLVYSVDLGSVTLPSFAPHTNYTWNLLDLQFNDSSNVVRWSAPSPYQYADSVGYTFDWLHYYVHDLSYFVVQGRSAFKQQIDTQTYTIAKPSGAVDTIAFPAYENVNYSSPHYTTAYPLTYGTTWGSSFNYVTIFNVTDAAMHYKHSSANHKTYYTETDTVIGWGKMHITAGNVDTNVKVLQTKIIRTSTDTFHLPNINLFDSLSLHQNYASAVYEQDFYQRGHLTPLVRVVFTDGTFTTVQSVQVNMDFAPPVNVGNVATNSADIRIYPNPVVNNKLFIEMPDAANGQWSYQLVNVAGQTIAQNTLASGAGRTEVNLPANEPAGIYYIRLFKNGQAVTVKAITINK